MTERGRAESSGPLSELLNELVAECLDRVEDEGPSAIDEVCRRHPEHEGVVRERLEILGAVGFLSGGDRLVQMDEFRLVRPLGEGGMGVVYLARDEKLGRDVALKVLRPDHAVFGYSRERFRRESAAVARLQHPGIVPVYSVGEYCGTPYFAMERIEGKTLAQVLVSLADRRPEQLAGRDLLEALGAGKGDVASTASAAAVLARDSWVAACARLCRGVAEALDHAHGRGVLHRDVKPSNVMLTPEGRVLLVDFGLARSSDAKRLTRTGVQLGSLEYMSPEHLRGDWDAVDERSDVYSLGVTLYELLALALPFRAASTELLVRNIESGRAAPMRRHNPAIPADVETVCLTAMEREPSRRYASAAAFARDLSNVLELRPIQATRAAVWVRARRWVQRHRAASVAIALGTVILIGAPLLFGLQERRARQRVERESLRADRISDEARDALARIDDVLDEPQYLYDSKLDRLTADVQERILEFYEEVVELGDDPEVRYERALTYARIARGERRLQQFARSEESFRTSIALLEQLADEQGDDSRLRADRALLWHEIGVIHSDLTHWDRSLEALERSAEILEQDGDVHPVLLGGTLARMAEARHASGEYEGSETAFDRAIELLNRDRALEDSRRLEILAGVLFGKARLLTDQGRSESARELVSRALELRRYQFEANPGNLAAKLEVAWTLGEVARFESFDGDVSEAVGPFEESLAHYEELVRLSGGRVDFRRRLAEGLLRLGAHLRAHGYLEESLRALDRASPIAEGLAVEPPVSPVHLRLYADLEIERYSALRLLGRPEEAGAASQGAMEAVDAIGDMPRPGPEERLDDALRLANLGSILFGSGQLEEAEAMLQLAFGQLSALPDPIRESTSALRAFAVASNNLGVLLSQDLVERRDEGLDHIEVSVEAMAELCDRFPDSQPYHCDLAWFHHDLANHYFDEGSWDAVFEAMEAAIDSLRSIEERVPGPRSAVLLRDFTEDLARFELGAGEHERAAATLERLRPLLPAEPMYIARLAIMYARCSELVYLDGELEESGADLEELAETYRVRAVDDVEAALEMGWSVDPSYLATAPWLALHGDPRFDAILEGLSD